jgi:AraC-like DNA-binding protein
MKKLFEPVYLDQASMFWDYGIRIERDFKGYYHWHQICEFVLVHQGKGTVVVNQHAFDIKRGMFFFFQPYQLHQVYADVSPESPYVRSIFYTDPLLIEKLLRSFPRRHARFEALWRSPNRANAFDLGDDIERMEWIFEQYEQATVSGTRENEEELTLLLLQMINMLPEPDSKGSRKEFEVHAGRTLRYSESVMRWIEDHYQEEVRLEQLAEEIHLSPNYISRIFRMETGSSITEYVTARRIKQACHLLEATDYSVEQVGTEAGFENVSYFIHLFKKVVGTTPLKYRHSKHATLR